MEEAILDIIVDTLLEERLCAKKNPDYEKLLKECIHIDEEIMKRLGDEKLLLLRSEELSAQCETVRLKDAYKQGLKDGIKLILEVYKN